MTELHVLASLDLTQTLQSQQYIMKITEAMASNNQGLQESVKQNSDRARELGNDIGQIVMSMQFQDITRQKLEHVYQPLERMHVPLQTVMDDTGEAAMLPEVIEELRNLEHSSTMESERLTIEAAHAGDEAVLVGTGGTDDGDNVTLF